MTVTQLDSGRFRVRYREAGNGNGNAKMRTFATRKEAEAFDVMVKASKLTGRPSPPPKPKAPQTLGAFAREYRDLYSSVELAENTLAVQRSLFNLWILPRLGLLPLDGIKPEDVQRFKADLIAEGIGDGALSKSLSILSAIMGKAVEWGRIERNPVSGIRKPSQRRRRVINALSPKEVERIRAAMRSESDRLLVSVLAYAGPRPGEALALSGADIGKQAISITKAIALGKTKTTKTGRDRSVPLLAPLAADLGRRDSGLLFPGPDGKPWTDSRWRYWRRHKWQPAVARAGLGTLTKGATKMAHTFDGPSPYTLRHSFASLMLAEQRTRYEVAELMGHSPAELDRTYSHVIAEFRGRPALSAVEVIDAARATHRVSPRVT